MAEIGGSASARLDGFKARALKATVRMSQEQRWHYEVEWSCMADDAPPVSPTLELLVIGGDALPEHEPEPGGSGAVPGRAADE